MLFVSILPTVSLLHWVNYNQVAISPLWTENCLHKPTNSDFYFFLGCEWEPKEKMSSFLSTRNIVIMCMCLVCICVFVCVFIFPFPWQTHPHSSSLSLPLYKHSQTRGRQRNVFSNESFTWCFPISPILHTCNQRAFELRGSQQQPCNWSPQTFRNMQVHTSNFRGSWE